MPTLPAAGYATRPAPTEQVPLAVPDAYQRIQASPRAFGAAEGAALAGLGGELEQATNRLAATAVMQQELHNQVAADEQTNYFEGEVNKVMYGDPDTPGDVGFMGKQGRDALDAREGVRKRIDDLIAERRGALQNDRQRMAFDSTTRRYRNFTLAQVGQHYNAEFKRHTAQTYDARADIQRSNAAIAANQGNFGAFQDFLGKGLASIKQGGEAVGLPSEGIEAKQREFTRTTAEAWARSAIERNPQEGLKFIEDNKDHLGERYDELHRAAAGKALNAQALDIVSGVNREGGAVYNRIAQVATEMNIDPVLATTTADIESSTGRNLGSRGNIFQLGNTEWASVGGGQKGNTETDIKNGLKFLQVKKQEMTAALGREPAGWEVYLAHQQGTGGAIALLSKSNSPARDVVPAENISANGGNPDAPASAFVDKVRNLYSRKASQAVKPDESVVAFGDSIAAHLVRKAGAGGKESGVVRSYRPGDTAVSGYDPIEVLKVISEAPDTSIRGKNIVLSTGTSNDPENKFEGSIPAQIAMLRSKGAASVTVMGVGTKYADRNARLEQIATENGATFSGPLRKVASDGIHSADPKAELQAPPLVAQVLEPGDEEVPGLVPKLNETMSRLPPNASPELKLKVLEMTRKLHNYGYIERQQQERLAKQAQTRTDEQVSNELITRMAPGGDNPPTPQEIMTHKYLSSAAKENLTRFLLATSLPGPPPLVAADNQAALHRRIGLDDGEPGKITSEAEINRAFDTERLITYDQNRQLINHFREMQGAATAETEKQKEQTIKAILPKIRPLHSLGPLIEGQSDADAATRELNYRRFIDAQVREYRKGGKNPATLFDPESKDYVGTEEKLKPYKKSMEEALKGAQGTAPAGTDATVAQIISDFTAQKSTAAKAITDLQALVKAGKLTAAEARSIAMGTPGLVRPTVEAPLR